MRTFEAKIHELDVDGKKYRIMEIWDKDLMMWELYEIQTEVADFGDLENGPDLSIEVADYIWIGCGMGLLNPNGNEQEMEKFVREIKEKAEA
jgi:hypothetical protein